MERILHIGSILLLAVGASFGSDQATPKDSPPPPSPTAAKVAPPNGGVPKPGVPNGAQRLVNPSNVAIRLFRLSPEERDHALEKLPSLQAQENARKTLEWFDSLPKDQQEIQLRRLEHFAQLTPEKRIEVRQLVIAANKLPPQRKKIVGLELLRLQKMTEQERDATLHRPFFQSRFSEEELKIITGLADAWMSPL